MDDALTDFDLMDYGLVKWLHIVSSTLLFGTGLGTAFYMVSANATRDVHDGPGTAAPGAAGELLEATER